MDVRTASELLGCAPDASRTQIDHAFRARARAMHPDAHPPADPATTSTRLTARDTAPADPEQEAAAAAATAANGSSTARAPEPPPDLAALTEARGVLIAHLDARSGPRPFTPPPSPPAPLVANGVVAGGAVLLAAALAFALTGSQSPLAPVEPIVRSLVVFGALLAFALTGRRWLFRVAVIALALTAWTVLAWTTFGTLVGAFATVPAALILLTAGRRRAEHFERARRHRAASETEAEPGV
ncbi:hypothetical protein [Schumannella sp. 10F1B-5-1]|uniref:J domain-containing protein n=1 Tax=Schumannella sp. 10F1B-5-1 TaxID=2590780 RepID=UPI001131AA8F|nr:hypothetical protein [Schumannella sp. 10F1B-5-1]TPW73353.1 hypothetical protein FJ658_05600 [Schumannella sp. 10F1B-5-1]